VTLAFCGIASQAIDLPILEGNIMKTNLKINLITAVILMAFLHFGNAQQVDTTKEIEKALDDYLAAMSTRDVNALQAVLSGHFVAIEAGDKNANVGMVDTANGNGLLPPEGNRDWDRDKIKMASDHAQISTTHPSVAMASFILSFPLSEERVADLQAALIDAPLEFDEVRRKAAEMIISDRAVHNSMFAMLARHGEKWKIVCMSFPK
jgi:hypothetical protein